MTAPAALGGGDFDTQNEYSLSVSVPVGLAAISATYAASRGDTLGKSSGFGLQALYPLSKRTTLYVGGVSTATYDKLADSVRTTVAGAEIKRNRTFAAGMRHLFWTWLAAGAAMPTTTLPMVPGARSPRFGIFWEIPFFRQDVGKTGIDCGRPTSEKQDNNEGILGRYCPREAVECEVVFVSGGPEGLFTAIRMKLL